MRRGSAWKALGKWILKDSRRGEWFFFVAKPPREATEWQNSSEAICELLILERSSSMSLLKSEQFPLSLSNSPSLPPVAISAAFDQHGNTKQTKVCGRGEETEICFSWRRKCVPKTAKAVAILGISSHDSIVPDRFKVVFTSQRNSPSFVNQNKYIRN